MIFEDYEQAETLFQKLHNLHVNAEPDLYKTLDCIHKKRDFKKLVNSKNIILLCAEENGRIIGVSNTKLCTSGMTDVKIAFMDALYVADDFRGKGIGKKLFFETESIAKENGFETTSKTKIKIQGNLIIRQYVFINHWVCNLKDTLLKKIYNIKILVNYKRK